MTDRANLVRSLLIGDIIGKPGRTAVRHVLPDMRSELDLDLVVANGENVAAGMGLTPSLAEELLGMGIDVITSGNHIWDKREIYEYLETDRPVLRPLNYPHDSPGRGWLVHHLADGGEVAIINLMGRVYMNQLDSPFAAADALLDEAAVPLPPVRLVDSRSVLTRRSSPPAAQTAHQSEHGVGRTERHRAGTVARKAEARGLVRAMSMTRVRVHEDSLRLRFVD